MNDNLVKAMHEILIYLKEWDEKKDGPRDQWVIENVVTKSLDDNQIDIGEMYKGRLVKFEQ